MALEKILIPLLLHAPAGKAAPPVPSYEQLFPPAQERVVDESGYLAMAPQDTMFNQQGHDWLDIDSGIDINLPDLSDPYHVQRFYEREIGLSVEQFKMLEGKLEDLPPEWMAKYEKFVTAQKQLILKDLGYYSGSIDSIAGPMTKRAWSAFERDSQSRDWKARYALALRFFEAGKKTGKIGYYNQTVEHLYWIAQTYSILLPTKARNEMYDLLQELYNGYSVRQNDGVRKAIEKRIGALAWYGRDNPVEAKKHLIKVFQAQIYLFPNRGPPRGALRLNGEGDKVPIRTKVSWDEARIIEGWQEASEQQIKKIYFKLFPERKTNY